MERGSVCSLETRLKKLLETAKTMPRDPQRMQLNTSIDPLNELTVLGIQIKNTQFSSSKYENDIKVLYDRVENLLYKDRFD